MHESARRKIEKANKKKRIDGNELTKMWFMDYYLIKLVK